MLNVIFICTGNICRSAMAHAYLEYKLKTLRLEDKVNVFSAGIYATNGENATEYAKEVIRTYGGDLSKHRATNIYSIDLKNMDYILVMTKEHKERILFDYPELKEKIKLLKEYHTKSFNYLNIDDPWGLSKEVYKKCAEEIVNCVDNLLLELTEKVKCK